VWALSFRRAGDEPHDDYRDRSDPWGHQPFITGLQAKTLLVIEDDVDNREAIAHALRRCGYAVHVAGNGRAAIDLLAGMDTPPDLIVLDWMMPVMSGFEFLTYQATDASLKSIPVLVLSAVDRPLKVAGLPVVALLTKPVRMRTLVDVIDRLCGHPKRPRELFASGRYPAIGTTPPIFTDETPGPEPSEPVAPRDDRSGARTAPTVIIKPPRGAH
jgi:CheY-like chemotaxis protein